MMIWTTRALIRNPSTNARADRQVIRHGVLTPPDISAVSRDYVRHDDDGDQRDGQQGKVGTGVQEGQAHFGCSRYVLVEPEPMQGPCQPGLKVGSS